MADLVKRINVDFGNGRKYDVHFVRLAARGTVYVVAARMLDLLSAELGLVRMAGALDANQ
jgi:hypothetical protein